MNRDLRPSRSMTQTPIDLVARRPRMKPPRRPGPEADASGLTPEDRRIWSRVSGSVTPPKTRKAERVVEPGPRGRDPEAGPRTGVRASSPRQADPVRPQAPARPGVSTRVVGRFAPEELEPRRQRRLSRERESIDGSIDLHGFGRFEAEDQLRAFLISAQARGWGAVLVITGQGRRGGMGVIRGSVREWLGAPALRSVVSGFAAAHRRHGGDGAIYVTLRRR